MHQAKCLGIAALLLGMVGCDKGLVDNSSTGATPAGDLGKVALTLNLGQVGVLARSAQMNPARLVLAFASAGAATVRDTIALTGSGSVSKSYSLASQREWTLQTTGLDQRDSVLYAGSQAFTVLARKTTTVSMTLDPRYSSVRVRFPVRDSLTRFVLSVDGLVWGDSSVAKQARVGDTVKMDRDYLAASAAGVSHAFSVRVFGSAWGIDTLLYSLDTTLSVVSGANQGRSLLLKWVGSRTPPNGQATLAIAMGAVGQLDIGVGYEDTGAVSGTFIDNRDGASYKWVKVGSQTWMAENLNFQVDSSWWYGNDPANGAKYGRLYLWASMMALNDSCNYRNCASQIATVHRGVCPSGWHIPKDAEWFAFWRTVAADSAYKLKSVTGWSTMNGLDVYGFNGKPAGMRLANGKFASEGSLTQFWSPTQMDSVNGLTKGLELRENVAYWGNAKRTAASVRCLKD